VAHTCNPTYSGSRHQEDRSSKPAQANSSARPYLEKPFVEIGLAEWLKVKALSSSPSNTKIKRRRSAWVVLQIYFKYTSSQEPLVKDNYSISIRSHIA
jgi:hypothetical protein